MHNFSASEPPALFLKEADRIKTSGIRLLKAMFDMALLFRRLDVVISESKINK